MQTGRWQQQKRWLTEVDAMARMNPLTMAKVIGDDEQGTNRGRRTGLMLPGDVAEKFPLLLGTFRFILKTSLKRTRSFKKGD